MADIATLTARKAEAEEALHKLMTGQAAVTVGYDGRSVSYTPARQAELRAYIKELDVQLGNITSARRAPLGISV